MRIEEIAGFPVVIAEITDPRERQQYEINCAGCFNTSYSPMYPKVGRSFQCPHCKAINRIMLQFIIPGCQYVFSKSDIYKLTWDLRK
jgi:hypothetical protein